MNTVDVLVVDDEAHLRELIVKSVIKFNFSCDEAQGLQSAKRCLARTTYRLILTDLRMEDGDGLELLEYVQQQGLKTPLVMMTAYASPESAVQALKQGALDYLIKPIKPEALRSVLHLLPHHSDCASDDVEQLLVGRSDAILRLREGVRRVAKTMAPVAVLGESGSGKEVVARAIHALGLTSKGPFVAVNCGAIPEHLLEAELFGYKKGAFTGANRDSVGLFLAASSGTLFLDEIAELPLSMQVKLLRVLQEKTVRPIGQTEEIPINARLISATHQNLVERVKLGLFRQDLYYRLQVLELEVPALRHRREDVPLLAEVILAKKTPLG